MLKLIHVQARLIIHKGQATVRQMDPNLAEDYQRAAEVIALFEQALSGNQTSDKLNAILADYTGSRLDYRDIDGLAKLICDNFSTFEPIKINFGSSLANASNNIDLTDTLQSTNEKTATPLRAINPETVQGLSPISAFRLAVWREVARPEYLPFANTGLTVALKPGVQSLRRVSALHDEDLLGRLLTDEKRLEILQNAAKSCGYNIDNSQECLAPSMLFSDLPGRHRLVSLSPDLTVENLLNRYNIELLRGVLYLAPRLRIVVRDKYKDLFKYIKLFGLMHELKPIMLVETKTGTEHLESVTDPLPSKENEIGGYEIILEGASSPFLARLDRRYGIQFAKFLPALLLCEADWSLEAELVMNTFTKGSFKSEDANSPQKSVNLFRAMYKLGPQPNLKSHFKASGEFDSVLEENLATAFEERFKQTGRTEKHQISQPEIDSVEASRLNKKSKRKLKPPKVEGERAGWTIKREDRIVPVFDTVMIPDFAFEHSDGRRALLEIVGFWEPRYLERKIAKLNRAGRSDIIVLVSERTRCGRDNFLVKGQAPTYQLIFFKGTPRLGPIMEALEQCALKPESSVQ